MHAQSLDSARRPAGVAVSLALVAPAAAQDTRIFNGSPTGPFSQNKQNEPAVAIDQRHPNILAAGANDNIDMEACNVGTRARTALPTR